MNLCQRGQVEFDMFKKSHTKKTGQYDKKCFKNCTIYLPQNQIPSDEVTNVRRAEWKFQNQRINSIENMSKYIKLILSASIFRISSYEGGKRWGIKSCHITVKGKKEQKSFLYSQRCSSAQMQKIHVVSDT